MGFINNNRRTNDVKSVLVALVCVAIATIIFVNIFSSGKKDNVEIGQKKIDNNQIINDEVKNQKYKALGTLLQGSAIAKKHYLSISSTKPSYDEVKDFIVTESKNGCVENINLCEYYLWDNEKAYNNAVYGSDDLLSGDAIEIATKNKVNLAGYINSGDLVFYYGTTGDGSADSGTIFDGEKEFINF